MNLIVCSSNNKLCLKALSNELMWWSSITNDAHASMHYYTFFDDWRQRLYFYHYQLDIHISIIRNQFPSMFFRAFQRHKHRFSRSYKYLIRNLRRRYDHRLSKSPTTVVSILCFKLMVFRSCRKQMKTVVSFHHFLSLETLVLFTLLKLKQFPTINNVYE